MCDYEQGFVDGLERAVKRVKCAPLLAHGTRLASAPGGFPKVADHAVDPDGNSDFVYNNYALRDAILHWLQEDIAQFDGNEIAGREERAAGSPAPSTALRQPPSPPQFDGPSANEGGGSVGA